MLSHSRNKIYRMVSLFCFFILLSFLFTIGPFSLKNLKSDAQLQNFFKNEICGPDAAHCDINNFELRRFDFNQDGRNDFAIEAQSSDFCGSGGCSIWLGLQKNNRIELIGEFLGETIESTSQSKNGFKTLKLTTKFYEENKNIFPKKLLQWDGHRYIPAEDSTTLVSPDQRLKASAAGDQSQQILEFLKTQQCPDNAVCRLEDFKLQSIDLNGDQKKDLIIQAKKGGASEAWMCWSWQCMTELALQMPSGEFKSIGAWPNNGFEVLKSASRGFKDLKITYKEFRVDADPKLTTKLFRWDGEKYSK